MEAIKIKRTITGNFTIIPNDILRDKRLSPKARFLLVFCLSLSENWDFSTRGLAKAVGCSPDAIVSGLKELEECCYLTRESIRTDKGMFVGTRYVFFDSPYTENPYTENPYTEKPTQRNTNINNNKNNISQPKTKPPKKHYAETVLLTEDEYQKLVNSLGEEKTKEMIQRLDDYKASTGKRYASDYRTILNWHKRDLDKQPKQNNNAQVDISQYDISATEGNNTNFLDELFEGD